MKSGFTLALLPFFKFMRNFHSLVYFVPLFLMAINVTFSLTANLPGALPQQFFSPVIPGYNADPSICRVNDDYYLVTSSSEYFPGIPVYHSNDLVDWKMVGHVLNRPGQLNLEGVECNQGVFAPTIRYHKGVFYVVSTLTGVTGERPKGNFLVTATNPGGPWSDPLWLPDSPGIDPSLFFDDDGKVYIHGNFRPEQKLFDSQRDIWLQELDLKTGRLKGAPVTIVTTADYYNKQLLDKGIENGVSFFEAPHIYKKNGWYYLIISHGGTFQNHAVSVWRSRFVFGPYHNNPSNPILTHRHLNPEAPVTSTGHADFVETVEGDWYAVYLARRPYGGNYHILGRETFLSSVKWLNDWPVIHQQANIGKFNLEITDTDHPLCVVNQVDTIKDEFNTKTLAPDWTFIRTPTQRWWSLAEKQDWLVMLLRPEKITDPVNPSFIGRRQQTSDAYFYTKLRFTPLSDSEEAGLAIVRDRNNLITFTITKRNNQPCIQLVQYVKGQKSENVRVAPLPSLTDCYLKIESDGVLYTFSYSTDALSWDTLASELDARFLGAAEAGRFTGTFTGFYASSNSTISNNKMIIDWITTVRF